MRIIKQPQDIKEDCQRHIPPESTIIHSSNAEAMNRLIEHAFTRWAAGDVFSYKYTLKLYSRDCHGRFYPIKIHPEDTVTINFYEDGNDRLIHTVDVTGIVGNIISFDIDEEVTRKFPKGYYKIECVLKGNAQHYIFPELRDFEGIIDNSEVLLNNGYFVMSDFLKIEHRVKPQPEDLDSEEVLDDSFDCGCDEEDCTCCTDWKYPFDEYYFISGTISLVSESIRSAYNLSSHFVIPLQIRNYQRYVGDKVGVEVYYEDGMLVQQKMEVAQKDGTVPVLLDSNCISRYGCYIRIITDEGYKDYHIVIDKDILIQSRVINPPVINDNKKINFTCGISYREPSNTLYFKGTIDGSDLPITIVMPSFVYNGVKGTIAYKQGMSVGSVEFTMDSDKPVTNVNIPLDLVGKENMEAHITIKSEDGTADFDKNYVFDFNDLNDFTDVEKEIYPEPECMYVDKCIYHNSYKLCPKCRIREQSLEEIPFTKQILDENHNLIVVY